MTTASLLTPIHPILTIAEASHYGDPALRNDRPIIWINDVPHIIRGVRHATPRIGDVLELSVYGRPGSRILISKPDSIDVSRRLRAGSVSIELGRRQDAQLLAPPTKGDR